MTTFKLNIRLVKFQNLFQNLSKIGNSKLLHTTYLEPVSTKKKTQNSLVSTVGVLRRYLVVQSARVLDGRWVKLRYNRFRLPLLFSFPQCHVSIHTQETLLLKLSEGRDRNKYTRTESPPTVSNSSTIQGHVQFLPVFIRTIWWGPFTLAEKL